MILPPISATKKVIGSLISMLAKRKINSKFSLSTSKIEKLERGNISSQKLKSSYTNP